MNKQYKQINNRRIEEIYTVSKIIEKEIVEDEIKMLTEDIQRVTEKRKELIDLLKLFK